LQDDIGGVARRRPPGRTLPRSLWLSWLAGGTAYSALSLFLLANYRQPPFDLALYDQTIWLIGHGFDFNTVAGIHIFGAHMSPVLYLLAPLSWLGGGAVPELVFQGFWIAAGVIPAYLLGNLIDRGRLFAGLYLLHPAIASGVAFGTRPWNLAVPVMMLFAWLVASRASLWKLMLVGMIIALFREDMVLWILLVVVVGWRSSGLTLTKAFAILAGPVAWSSLALIVFLPEFSPIDTYIYQQVLDPAAPELNVPFGAAATILRLMYLAIPFGLAAIWDNRALILATAAIPLAGLVLKGGFALTPFFQYEMHFIPLFLVIIATGNSMRLNPRMVAVGLVTMSVLIGPLRPWNLAGAAPPLAIDRSTVQTWRTLEETLVPLLDHGESAALPSLLVTHFAERRQITIFPYPFDAVVPEPYAMDCPNPQVVVVPPSVEWETPGWDAAVDDYSVVFAVAGFTGYVLDEASPSTGCRYPQTRPGPES